MKYLKINELEGYFDDDFFSIIQLEIFSFGLTLLNVVEGLWFWPSKTYHNNSLKLRHACWASIYSCLNKSGECAKSKCKKVGMTTSQCIQGNMKKKRIQSIWKLAMITSLLCITILRDFLRNRMHWNLSKLRTFNLEAFYLTGKKTNEFQMYVSIYITKIIPIYCHIQLFILSLYLS